MKSKIKFENVDITWATIYCALNTTYLDIVREDLASLIPKRRSNKGTPPSVTTVETDESKDRWKWFEPPDYFTEEEKAKVLQIMITTTFKTHHYKFNNKTYKQKTGGPIGLKATGYVVRATMDDWIEQFRKKLDKLGVKVHLLTKYVDDVLIVCRNAKLGF